MKINSIVALILSSSALLAGSVSAFADTKPADNAAGLSPDRKAKNPEGWPVLKAGTPAEEIRRLVGRPDVIRPMEAKDGKAEVWVYRRLAKHIARQSATTTENVSAYTGMGDSGGANINVAVPSFRMEHVMVYQVSSLLMFDGKLVTGTQKVETERHFE